VKIKSVRFSCQYYFYLGQPVILLQKQGFSYAGIPGCNKGHPFALIHKGYGVRFAVYGIGMDVAIG
jgi:hypothetical protein